LCNFVFGWLLDAESQPPEVETGCRRVLGEALGPALRKRVEVVREFLSNLITDAFSTDTKHPTKSTAALRLMRTVAECAVSAENVDQLTEFLTRLRELSGNRLETESSLFSLRLAALLLSLYKVSQNEIYFQLATQHLHSALQNWSLTFSGAVEAVQVIGEGASLEVNKRMELLKLLLSLCGEHGAGVRHIDSFKSQLAEVLGRYLDTTSLPALQAAYSLVVETLKEVFGQLKAAVDYEGTEWEQALVKEKVGCVLLKALGPLLRVKGSIIIVSRVICDMFSGI